MCGSKPIDDETVTMDPPDDSEYTGENSCSKPSRVLLFIFNFIIWVGSCALLGLGIYLFVADQYASKVLNLKAISVAGIILIIVGGVGFFISFLGCCGACIRSKCLVMTYVVVMIILFIVLVVGGIIGYFFNSKIDEAANKAMQGSLTAYDPNNPNSDIVKAWDVMQKTLHCCGINTYQDWSTYNSAYRSFNIMPASCCVTDSSTQSTQIGCTTGINPNAYYSQAGCLTKVVNFFHQNIPYIGIAGGVVALFIIIGVIMGIIVFKLM